MGHWSISRKLYGGVGCLAVLLLVAIVVGYYELSAVNTRLETIATAEVRKVELALRIDESTTALKSHERSLLVGAYGDDLDVIAAAKKDLTATLAAIDESVAELDSLLVRPEAKKVMADLSSTVDAWAAVNVRVQALALDTRAGEAWAVARSEGDPLIDRTATQAGDLVTIARGLVAASQAEANAAETKTAAVFGVLLLVAVALVALVVWTVRGIVVSLLRNSDTLHDGAQQVTSAATQVSGAAQSLSQAATEQAASLEETSASMEEMASMTRTNAESAGKAAELVMAGARDFEACDVALKEMVGSMAQISESSQRISKIIKTIDEIAFQTNILALNAAVEAARAGEAGMGFAVVADEVRNLAQRSAQAAKDTASLIEEAVTSAATGDERVKGLTVTISRISEQSAQVKGLVEQISQASAQQAQGVDQVAQAIQQMEKVTQTNAATAEESAAASEELNAQAESALATVGALRALVLGAGADHAAGHRPAPAARPRQAGRVVAMPKRAAVDPEREIPLESTGTFGAF